MINNGSSDQRSLVTIIFYDIAQINFFNYTSNLLDCFARSDKFKVVLCYDEPTENKKALGFLSRFSCFQVGAFSFIDSVIGSSPVGLVVVNAQRIPDSLAVAIAKTRGIPALMIQHGMYNGYLARENSLFF